MKDAALRKHLDSRLARLKTARQSWEPQMRDISRFILPRRGEFWSQPNGSRGRQKNQSVLDATGTLAARVLVAGLMGGLTSPTRPWFRLTTPAKEVASITAVKSWFDQCADRMRMVFNASNLYQVLPQLYEDLIFGQGCAILDFDFDDVIRLYPQTNGQFWLALDHRGRVDTMYREFPYTWAQIEDRWPGADPDAKAKAAGTEADTEVVICHAIEPNTAIEAGRLDWAGKPFRSVYWRQGAPEHRVLHRGGYQEFPVLAPRWAPTGNDAYSRGVGHDALPEVKSLQVYTKRMHMAVDKHVNPPMGAHISLRGSPSSTLPGAINYFASQDKGASMWALYQPAPQAIAELERRIANSQAMIKSICYADLFLMISDMEGVQPRNQLELSLRKEEKMLMLGPTLEALHDELIEPLIQRTFKIMSEHELFPPAPPELEGYPLEVELISVLAQAQKAADLGAIERTAAFVGSLGAANPAVFDKFDADEAIDIYNEKVGGPAAIVVGDDQVAKVRAARAQQQQAEQVAKLTLAGVQGAKVLSETEVGGGRSALQSVTGL